MSAASPADPADETSGGSRIRVFLLFGLPETGLEAVARAAAAEGVTLSADALRETGGFGISASLDTLATEINAGFGLGSAPFGPLVAANRSPAVSRRRIDRQLDRDLSRARSAVRAVVPTGGAGPVVIAAGAMCQFPRFWIRAFDQPGIDLRPVLLHRNPLAVAQLARVGHDRPVRRTIFFLHHLALETVNAAPDRVRIAIASKAAETRTLLGLSGEQPSAPLLSPHPRDDADLAASAIVSAQTRDLDRLLRAWDTLEDSAKRAAVADLTERFDDSVTATGAAHSVTLDDRPEAEPVRVPSARREPARNANPRTRAPLLLHYHIFKNAGTSVDTMLKANFGDAWVEQEFTEGPQTAKRQKLVDFLSARPALSAFSSHTAMLPVPDLPEREIVPILFVRHPLLRLRSAFQFERRQEADTRGAIFAKTADLRGYVEWLLADPRLRQARNFQAFRFAAGSPGPPAHERERALATLAALPFVGLVEAYQPSIDRLGALVRPLFPDFTVVSSHDNASAEAGHGTVEDRLAAMRGEIGPALYDRLVTENAIDLELFERVRASYDGAV